MNRIYSPCWSSASRYARRLRQQAGRTGRSTGGETVAPSSGTTAGAAAPTPATRRALAGQCAQGCGYRAPRQDDDLLRLRQLGDQGRVRADHRGARQALAADRGLKVRLEGNTDERGSAEYNVALGERRAQAVKRALLLQGATEGQLTTVSYGEERPVAEGHDETAWAQNRRVEIIYLGGR